MTIIQPNRKSKKFRWFFVVCAIFLACEAVGAVAFETSLVDLRHRLKVAERAIGEREVKNADLKNERYQRTMVSNAEEAGNATSLVVDRNPLYLIVTPRAVVARL